jgi:Xaa-Pro aminopeptidase
MARSILTQLDWPEYGRPEFVAAADCAEVESNIERARRAMSDRGLTHLVVYGDREHFGNLHYLSGFDPRFEEALLVIRADAGDVPPLMLVGNECEAYLAISPASFRVERYQYFSLLDQPREASRTLPEIFRGEGIDGGASVGCIGWKYYAEPGDIDLPAYLVDALRGLSPRLVTNAADLLMHPGHGLRTFANAREIAFSEYTNHLATEGMKRVLESTRPGATEFELLSQAPYNGLPQSCYWGLKTGPRRVSLASPRGLAVEPGYPISSNIAYWSANCSRAGWTVTDATELPVAVRGYIEEFAGPYFEACAEWLSALRPGASGGELHDLIQDRLPFDRFGVYLNAGHLIHNEEWLSSPVFAGSDLTLHSGMLLQSDIIPGSKVYGSSMRMEDTYAIAGEPLLAELKSQYPGTYRRCTQRICYMRDGLGIPLQPGVLPLSDLAGIVQPFWFSPRKTIVLYK